MCRALGRNAEKSLSFCHLTKQRLINELADGVDERHCWPDDSSPGYRPKFRVFSGKAYTEGVRHVAMAGEAWWLLNKIATVARFEPPVAQHPMQVWTLAVHGDHSAVLTCTDGDEHFVWQEQIDGTDFPLPTVTIWVLDQIMMLPSEY
jgi:hypothetical protein